MDSNQGIGALAPGFGAINSTNYTPMLNAPIKEKIWFYPIDHATNTATFQALDSKFTVKFPLHPFFGCIGVAPAGGEARTSVVPEAFGGNMDSPEASVGNTVYFPVNVPGAMLFLGDGHAAMGDGEIAGTALEVPLRGRVQVHVIKGQKISWPRFENDDYIMTVGAYRPLDDALRIAFTELVGWIHTDYGLSEMDAYELLSKVGEIHLNEMVDPNYVIVAKVKKSFLPKPNLGSQINTALPQRAQSSTEDCKLFHYSSVLASVSSVVKCALQLPQVLDNLRAGPVLRQDKLAANHAVAINDSRFRITCGSIQVVAVFG